MCVWGEREREKKRVRERERERKNAGIVEDIMNMI